MNHLQDIIDSNRRYFRIAGWVALAILALYVFTQVSSAMSEQSELVSSTDSVTADAEATGDVEAAAASTPETKTTTPTEAADPKTIGQIEVVISGSLNIRATASTSSKVLGSAAKGSKLGVIAQETGWYEVVDSKGLQGFVSADGRFVKVLSGDL